MIEKTLPTFLMKDGKLCDGGQASDEGAYCRFVTQMLTFSSSGCDNGKVTVTPNRHPITDKEVHDMVVHVDTTETTTNRLNLPVHVCVEYVLAHTSLVTGVYQAFFLSYWILFPT